MLKSFCNTNIICLKTSVSGIFDIYIRREFFQNLIRHLEDIGYALDFVQKELSYIYYNLFPQLQNALCSFHQVP